MAHESRSGTQIRASDQPLSPANSTSTTVLLGVSSRPPLVMPTTDPTRICKRARGQHTQSSGDGRRWEGRDSHFIDTKSDLDRDGEGRRRQHRHVDHAQRAVAVVLN